MWIDLLAANPATWGGDLTTCLRVEITVEMGNVLIEATSSTNVDCDTVSIDSTSAQATETAARKCEEWTVAKGDNKSRMVVLMILLEPINQLVFLLVTDDQRVASDKTSRGHVESNALFADATCSDVSFSLFPDVGPPNTWTKFAIIEGW